MSFFAGSVLMCLPLLVPVWSFGWRPWQISGDPLAGRELLGRIGPLLASNVARQRLALLRRGLDAATRLSLPAAFGLIGASPTLIHLLMPAQSVDGPLPALLAWFATPLVF